MSEVLGSWQRASTLLLVPCQSDDVRLELMAFLDEPVYHQWPSTRQGRHAARKASSATGSGPTGTWCAPRAAQTSLAPVWILGILTVMLLLLGYSHRGNSLVLGCSRFQGSRLVELSYRIALIRGRGEKHHTTKRKGTSEELLSTPWSSTRYQSCDSSSSPPEVSCASGGGPSGTSAVPDRVLYLPFFCCVWLFYVLRPSAPPSTS